MKHILFTGVLLITGWLYAQPAAVRVRLFSIEQPSEIRITSAEGTTVSLNARTLARPFRSATPVTIHRGKFEGVQVPYPIEVSARNGTLIVVAELPPEEYVAGVLAGEASGFRSDESLKAMAVAVRTYAAHFLNRHKAEGFNFCDSTHCQDLRFTATTPRLRKVTEATRRQVLNFQGQPIPAYYHQDCGGTTEPVAPYLRQTQDSFCIARRTLWTSELTVLDLHSTLGMKDVQRIEIIERTPSGRSRLLRVSGSTAKNIDAESFRLAVGRVLGWNRIPSDLYEVRRDGDRFVFEGYGAGHGIGLCQHGAAVMGELGHNYEEILQYYYPNTALVPGGF